MKKLRSALFAAAMFLGLCSGCGEAVLCKDPVTTTMSLTAHYDYGFHVQDKATLLLDGSTLFFDPAEYGIETIVAGDIVHVSYKGECYVQETYPSTIVTKDMTIFDITLTEADIVELKVMQKPGGGISLKTTDGTSIEYRYDNLNVIDRHNNFTSFSTYAETYAGQILYGSITKSANSVTLNALYAYRPRGDENKTDDKTETTEHVCLLVQLDGKEPTCQETGYSVIGCASCNQEYFREDLPKTRCSYGEDGKCQWCGGIQAKICENCGESPTLTTYRDTYGVYLCDVCFDDWTSSGIQSCCFCGSYFCTGCQD